MSVFRRGKTWWYKFTISGQLIRESAKTNSKTVAKGAELVRRRESEQAYNRIPKRERVPLFANAANVWLAGKTGLAPKSVERYKQCLPHLRDEFGKRLVCDIDANDVAEYQRRRSIHQMGDGCIEVRVLFNLSGQIDDAFGSEIEIGLTGFRVQRDQLIARRDREDLGLTAIRPVRDATA